MRAFFSGQAATSVVIGLKPQIRHLDGAVSVPWNASDALRVFDGCIDVQTVNIGTVEELDQRTELAWAEDRALRLLLFLLDTTETQEDLVDYAECLSELLDSYPVLLPLKRRLAAAPLPSVVDPIRVGDACAAVRPVRQLFEWILSIQGNAVRVREAYDAVSVASFGSEKDKAFLNDRLIAQGAFLDTVMALEDGRDLAFLRLDIVSKHRAFALPIAKWFERIQGNLKPLPRIAHRHETTEALEERDDFEADVRQPSYASFSSVQAQQRSIINKLKDRDLEGARWLMSEMIASQRGNSTSEQIGKSFCNMAKQAKLHDIPEIELEWSREATLANPLDPMTFGHLANALIDVGQYEEAEKALDEVELHGDALFAATGRARILRAIGRVGEARDAFVAAAQSYEGFPLVLHAKLGAAEALRELGDRESALLEYRRLSEEWPLEAVVWNGLASTQMELGMINEAMQNYSKATTHRGGTIFRVAGANAFRLIGDFDAALALYDEVLADYPNNTFALCGRADVLQNQGRFVEALSTYELAIERSPYRLEPLLGKAKALRNMGRLDEAFAVYLEAQSRFRFERRIAAGLIAVYRAQGRFGDALVAVDKLIRDFPFDLRSNLTRAAILVRLGEVDAALAIYDAILADHPRLAQAAQGKTALLIRLGRTTEAAEFVPLARPKTRRDWNWLLLQAFLVDRQRGRPAASRLLTQNIPRCPFASERRKMRDLLAAIELRQNHWDMARRVVETNPEEVSNVIALHVLAATHRSGQARVRLQRILDSDGPADVVDLAEEIARRYELIPQEPRRTVDWIRAAEQDLLLAEAA